MSDYEQIESIHLKLQSTVDEIKKQLEKESTSHKKMSLIITTPITLRQLFWQEPRLLYKPFFSLKKHQNIGKKAVICMFFVLTLLKYFSIKLQKIEK